MTDYLAKSDPDTYSLDDLERDRRTIWDGVRNPQALRAIAAMKAGDRVWIYHSGENAAVVGVAQVAGPPRPDPRHPKFTVVELEFAARLPEPITLRKIKESGLFDDWALVRQGRLSTMAAPAEFAMWLRKRFPKAGI